MATIYTVVDPDTMKDNNTSFFFKDSNSPCKQRRVIKIFFLNKNKMRMSSPWYLHMHIHVRIYEYGKITDGVFSKYIVSFYRKSTLSSALLCRTSRFAHGDNITIIKRVNPSWRSCQAFCSISETLVIFLK